MNTSEEIIRQEIRKNGSSASCSSIMKKYIRDSSAKYWAEKCDEVGIDYIRGEAPQNTRKRIREAAEAMVYEELDKLE